MNFHHYEYNDMTNKSAEKIPLNVLYLEDSSEDVEIITELLLEAGFNLSMDCTENKKEFITYLRAHNHDIILSDFNLPGFDAFGALELSKRICSETPFICVSGSIGEEIAIDLIKQGAVDYVLKDRLVRLPTAIHRALDEVKEKKSRVHAEDALRKSERRFQVLAEHSPVGIFQTDSKGSTVYVNSRWCQISGLSKDEAMGNGWFSAVHREDREQLRIGWEKATQATESSNAEYRFVHKNNTISWVIGQAVPERDSKDIIIGYIGTITDITERKQTEDALRQMQKLEGLGTLAGGIAHDFNNILGIILAYITSIKRFKNDSEKLNLATATITKAVERGKTLVQQILTFARKTETEFGAVKVNDVVMEIMTMIFETFPKNLTYAQSFDKSISYINADHSQLYQVLLNLCVNARDAMPDGGSLTINTRMVSVASLRSQHPDAEASAYVCIEVSDTGEGMTGETRKRIFEPFYTTKGIGKGTGLGLSVVFGIIQNHKGFIDVESEQGKGTKFRLFLPATEVAVPTSEIDEELVEDILGGTETLLLVEDEEMLLMSLQLVLEEKGYTVLSAMAGLDALNIYQEKTKNISLVLTDLGLPTISGLEVCRRIKQINPKERMILATGFLDPEMKTEFLKAGIQHFLFKPYDLAKVLKMVREVIDAK